MHSLKDLPTGTFPGLCLAAVLERGDPADAIVARERPMRLADLPTGALVGTCSLRRRAQLLMRRPDLEVVEIRGNVPGRIRQLDAGAFDALVLARAGLERLRLAHRVSEVLPADDWLPAPGQGAIAVEARADDWATQTMARALDHPATRLATAAERAFMHALGGGCRAPVAARAAPLAFSTWSLTGMASTADGRRMLRDRVDGKIGADRDADALGRRLAERLLARGARGLFAQCRS